MHLLEPTKNQRQLVSQALWFGAWFCVTGVGAFLSPDRHGHGTHQQLGLPPCPSVLLFNRPCPACGLTTSWTATIHFDFPAAFAAHPLGPILYLLFTASAFIALYGAVTGRHFRTDTPFMNRFSAVVAILFFGYGFFRMATTNNFRSERAQAMVNFVTGRPPVK